MNTEFELRCPIGPDLGYIRDLVRIHGQHHGLTGERLDDLAIAVNEAVTNVFDHGGRAGLITARDHEHGVTVEILDAGGGLTPEHLAAAIVDPAGNHGFGLWIIQHLCDEVAVEQTGLGSPLSLHMSGRPATVVLLDRSARHTRRDLRRAVSDPTS
ncbi:ATP-binding protein [Nonomuraea sp. NPDC049709]|uniref:ATP-binding protein n=1 Tax=Nonomuraea sp. NPDC049709 TaxID=3154736 RepID=UPI003444C797